MSKIDLQDSRWCRIIFDGRNQEYGAYALRSQYSENAMRALLIAVLVLGTCSYLPILASVIGKRKAINEVSPDPVMTFTELNVPQHEQLPLPEIPPPSPAVSEIRYTAPEIVPQRELNAEDLLPPAETIPADALPGDETREGLSRFEVPLDAPEDGEGNELVTGEVVRDELYNMANIQKKPEFPGGMDGILPFIRKNFRYPRPAVENHIEGTVFVQFTIDKDGSIIDVNAVRGQELGGGLAEEAVRVIRSMPKWKPGEQNGRKVKVSYTLPVAARLTR